MRESVLGSVFVLLALLGSACGGKCEKAESSASAPARPAQWAQPIENLQGLPNFHQVSDILYRGAQPEDEGFAELKKLGIQTVVNLRSLHSDRSECEEAELDYVKINCQAWEAEEEEVVDFLKVLADPDRRPVFVHCQHGADRTGMMVAVYRVIAQGWSKEDAIAEMTEGGFGYHSIWKELIEYIEELDADHLRQLVAASDG